MVNPKRRGIAGHSVAGDGRRNVERLSCFAQPFNGAARLLHIGKIPLRSCIEAAGLLPWLLRRLVSVSPAWLLTSYRGLD